MARWDSKSDKETNAKFGDPRLPERFWKKVRVAPSGCWEWTGAHMQSGYGQVGAEGRVQPTHRVAYEALIGPIPDGLEVDHLCSNKPCCNPAHLEPVTHAINVKRGPMGNRETCRAGLHPWPESAAPNGRRLGPACRECRNAARRKLRASRPRPATSGRPGVSGRPIDRGRVSVGLVATLGVRPDLRDIFPVGDMLAAAIQEGA